MPKFVNTNDHPVRVGKSDSLRRIIPGQVVEADGEFADQLKGTSGVESANQTHEKAWADRNAGPSDQPGPDELAGVNVGPALAAIGKLAVSDPLQVVIGDDSAPHGPPTGTVTTRSEARKSGDPLEKLAFGEPGVDAAVDREADTGQTAKEPERFVAEMAQDSNAVAEVIQEQSSPAKRTARQRRRSETGTTPAEERKQSGQ